MLPAVSCQSARRALSHVLDGNMFQMHVFMHVDVYASREAGHISLSFCLSVGPLFDAQMVCEIQLQGALSTQEWFANDKCLLGFESTESNTMP